MDQKLKQRLVGAIVLVSLAVFFIPIILEGPESDWVARNQAMPEPPAIDFLIHKQPQPLGETLSMPVVAEKADGLTDADTPAIPASQVTTPPTVEKLPVESTDKPAKAAAPSASPEPRFPPGSWGIQLGSFSSKANASGLHDKLEAAQYPSFLEADKGKSGAIYKVIAGPYGNRDSAEKARNEISARQGIKGFLTDLGS